MAGSGVNSTAATLPAPLAMWKWRSAVKRSWQARAAVIMPAMVRGGRERVMKRDRQFLPPRQSVLYGYTRRMLDETAQNANSFAMEVAERYLSMVAPDVRTVPFRLGEGDDLVEAMRANGQTLRRYMDGTVKTLPADLEDAWVLSLPEPYRGDCERDLARRRGMLAVPVPNDDGLKVASVSRLFSDYANLVQALAPAIENGSFGPEDLPYKQPIYDTGDDVIAAVIGIRRELDRGIGSGMHGG